MVIGQGLHVLRALACLLISDDREFDGQNRFLVLFKAYGKETMIFFIPAETCVVEVLPFGHWTSIAAASSGPRSKVVPAGV